MIPWKSHGNILQNHGRIEYHSQNNERSENESDKSYFHAMTDFEIKCKPRVVGHWPHPLDYIVQVFYVYVPGNYRMTSFKITTEWIIIYETIRDPNTRRI